MAGYAFPLDAALEAGEATIAQAQATIRKARAICAATVALHAECAQRRARSRAGRSDCATVIDLILGHGLCDVCLAQKTTLSPERIRAVLLEVARHYTVARSDSRCEGCLTQTVVYRLG